MSASGAVKSQKAKLYVGTATAGSPLNITGVTLGNPTILTIASNTLNNGDVVTLAAIGGTTMLNGLTPVVKYRTTNTVAIDVDTTGATAYTSGGTATPQTWTKAGQIKSNKPSGATAATIDVTDLDSDAKEFLTGLIDNGTCSFEYFANDSDLGLAALEQNFNNSLSRQYKIVYSAGVTPNRTFTASVTKFMPLSDVAVDGVLTGTAELKISGAVVKS